MAPKSDPKSEALIIGLMLLGVVVVGVTVVLAGLCLLACGEPLGVLIILAGLALIGLAIWAYTRLGTRVSSQIEARSLRRSRWSLQDEPPSSALAVNVHVNSGWTPTALRRTPDGPLVLRIRGRVFGPWGWLASPNGDGVAAGPDAPLPGAPELGLIARVGDELLFVGADPIPAGPDAEIALRLNVGPREASVARGYFHVAPA